MRKLLMITTALVTFTAAPRTAHADPITTIVALTANGVGFGAAVWAVAGGAITNLGISIGLNLLSQKLMGGGRPGAPEQRRELTRPNSLPAYRFVYGHCWAPGTPVAFTVKGSIFYGCFLLNSRASAGPFVLLFDKRPTEKTGDEFDFAEGGGAVCTNEPFVNHARYWIGKGDQTTLPTQILRETGDYFKATDAWRGCTVVWVRLDAGGADRRNERWPAAPPEIMVEGNWSLLADPAGGAPSFSRNQARAVYDALVNNPMRAYDARQLWTETFVWAAAAADEPVAVKGGGTVPRYRCDGVLVFAEGAELEDQLKPLMDAGASRFVRANGQLGMVPAIARQSVIVLDDYLDGQPIECQRYKPGDDLATSVIAQYVSPARAYEQAEAPAYEVAGAQKEDGGLPKQQTIALDFVTDHRQGQRLAKITAMRSRMQRSVSAEFPPVAFNLVSGSVATLDLGSPYGRWAGDYEVEQIHPAADLMGEGGISLRCPAVLRETSHAIYAWDAEAEEQDVEGAVFDPFVSRIRPPGAVTLFTGGAEALVNGRDITPRVRVAVEPTDSASLRHYVWEYQQGRSHANDDGLPEERWTSWRTGGTISPETLDENGKVFGFISPAVVGALYVARVKSVGIYGESDWVVSDKIAAAAPERLLPMPSLDNVTGGSGQITVTATQASDMDASTLELWMGTNSNVSSAVLWLSIDAAPSVSVTRTRTGLGNGVNRFFFARALDQWGNPSPFTAGKSATTTPAP